MDSTTFQQSTRPDARVSAQQATEQDSTPRAGFFARLKKPLTLRVSGSTKVVCFSHFMGENVLAGDRTIP
jgi:hypothetical protein